MGQTTSRSVSTISKKRRSKSISDHGPLQRQANFKIEQQQIHPEFLNQSVLQLPVIKQTRKTSDQSAPMISQQYLLQVHNLDHIQNLNQRKGSNVSKNNSNSSFIYSQASTKLSDQHMQSSNKSDSSQQQQISVTKLKSTNNLEYQSMSKAISILSSLANMSTSDQPLDISHNQKPKLDARSVMIQRYLEHFNQMPDCDQQDREFFDQGLSSQVAPDYASEIYKKLLRQECQEHIQNLLKPYLSKDDYKIAKRLRNKAAHRILSLCKEKGYRQETHLLGVNILDKFLSLKMLQQSTIYLQEEQILLLVVTCTIIAAKIEQPMTPSINRMITLLTDEERRFVTKEGVIRCEDDVLKTFDFDFNMLSPMPFFDRFMRLADYHNEFFIDQCKFELLKLMTSDISFLDYRNSHKAAASLVACLNLIDIQKSQFVYVNQQLRGINLDIAFWDDKLETVTGILKQDFEQVFRRLAKLINYYIFSRDDDNFLRKLMLSKLK